MGAGKSIAGVSCQLFRAIMADRDSSEVLHWPYRQLAMIGSMFSLSAFGEPSLRGWRLR
jgi:hypothetical protein